MILSGKIPAKDHIVSVDGVRKGPVTKASAKRSGDRLLFAYEFKDGDKTRTVTADTPLLTGKPGGDDKIQVDGKDVKGDDFVISSPDIQGLTVFVRLFFRWMVDDHKHEIRIDPHVKIPGLGGIDL